MHSIGMITAFDELNEGVFRDILLSATWATASSLPAKVLGLCC